MANWITHTILAERLLARGLDIDDRGFVVGNIAPDCNQENEDWSAFTPPREITHWMLGRNALFRDIAIYENNWAFEHPNSAYHQILRKVVQFPDYLPMFPVGAVSRKIAVMTGETTQTYPEDPFPFFTKQEWQDFLTDTEERLLQMLKEKASV